MNTINETSSQSSLRMKLDYMVSHLQRGLMADLCWLLEESNDHNVVINVGESPNIKSYKAHANILSARSLYFRAILSNGRNSSSSRRNSLIEITQENIKPAVFDVILKFIYTGRISLDKEKSVEEIFEYIIAAENLWLYQLVQYLENYLLTNMQDWLKSNFVYVLTITQKNYNSFILLREFVDNILKIHPYSLYYSNDFHNLPESILIDLLQNRKFPKDMSEEKIWDIVLDWGIKQDDDLSNDKKICDWTDLDFSRLQTRLQRCVPLIRFTDIPPNVFYEKVSPYKTIFTYGLYDRIMQSPKFAEYNKKFIKKQYIVPTSLSDLLLAFPRPPPSPISESSLSRTSSIRKKSKPQNKPLVYPSSAAIKHQPIISSTKVKSKHILVKRKTQAVLFRRQDDSRKLSRSKSMTSLCSIETSIETPDESLLPTKIIPAISPQKETRFTKSEGFEQFEALKSQFDTNLIMIRKTKGLNRQTSIISSRPPTPSSTRSSSTLYSVF